MVKKKYNYDTDKCKRKNKFERHLGHSHPWQDPQHPWSGSNTMNPRCREMGTSMNRRLALTQGHIFLLKHYGQLMVYIYLFYDWWRWWRPLLVYAGIFIVFLYVYQLPVAWPMMIQVVADFIGFYKVSASSEWTEISAGVSLLVFYFMVRMWLNSHLWRHFFLCTVFNIILFFLHWHGDGALFFYVSIAFVTLKVRTLSKT